MIKQELEEKIYSMSNSFLPLDVFYNDIRDNPIENYDKERAYKDIEIIADFIIDLQSQLDQQKAMWQKLKEWISDIWKQDLSKELSNGSKYSTKHLIHSEKLLYKMQELEQGGKNEN